jgi:hypothetical protein
MWWIPSSFIVPPRLSERVSNERWPGNLPARGAVVPDVASWRENRAGEIEVQAHRWKTILMLLLAAVLAAGSVFAVVADPGAWLGWAGLALFGGGGLFFAWKQVRLGLLGGRPALVLGPDGLTDRVAGFHVAWSNVEALELWELHVRGTTQRWLGVRVRDPEAVTEYVGPLGDALNDLVLPGRPPLNVSLNLLAPSTEELVALVRRFWRGEISGGGVLPAGPRRSRARRFLGWLGGWAITFALGIALVVVFVVVAESC